MCVSVKDTHSEDKSPCRHRKHVSVSQHMNSRHTTTLHVFRVSLSLGFQHLTSCTVALGTSVQAVTVSFTAPALLPPLCEVWKHSNSWEFLFFDLRKHRLFWTLASSWLSCFRNSSSNNQPAHIALQDKVPPQEAQVLTSAQTWIPGSKLSTPAKGGLVPVSVSL